MSETGSIRKGIYTIALEYHNGGNDKCGACKGSGHSDYDPYEQYKGIGK